MIIISGVRLAGKVDAIPRVGHVATRFFHLYYVPLIPLGSYLVMGEGTDERPGVPLPLNSKSVVVGWLRGAAWVGLITAGVMLFLGLTENRPQRVVQGLWIGAIASVWLPVLYFWRFLTRANYQRSQVLAQQANFSPEQILLLEVTYGRLTADQAERVLKRLNDDEDRLMSGMIASSPGR